MKNTTLNVAYRYNSSYFRRKLTPTTVLAMMVLDDIQFKYWDPDALTVQAITKRSTGVALEKMLSGKYDLWWGVSISETAVKEITVEDLDNSPTMWGHISNSVNPRIKRALNEPVGALMALHNRGGLPKGVDTVFKKLTGGDEKPPDGMVEVFYRSGHSLFVVTLTEDQIKYIRSEAIKLGKGRIIAWSYNPATTGGWGWADVISVWFRDNAMKFPLYFGRKHDAEDAYGPGHITSPGRSAAQFKERAMPGTFVHLCDCLNIPQRHTLATVVDEFAPFTSTTNTNQEIISMSNTTPATGLSTRCVETKAGWVGQVLHGHAIVWESEPVPNDKEFEGEYKTPDTAALELASDAVAAFYETAFNNLHIGDPGIFNTIDKVDDPK